MNQGIWIFDGKRSLDPKLLASLRRCFDQRFSDPKAPVGNDPMKSRFVWDYWNIQGQYNLLRSPAASFFGEKLYDRLTQSLLHFGRNHFGCTGITPPWISAYVEGCYQGLHVDMPHGPLAYVLSLTMPQKNKKGAQSGFAFSGGNTLLLNSRVLDYWNHYDRWNGAEQHSLIDQIEPQFGRLSVFDPRIPHGVSEVRGTKDIRQARIVIHGWFSNPQPAISGTLSAQSANQAVVQILEKVDQWVKNENLRGLISFSFEVNKKGKVAKLKGLVSTLQSLDRKTGFEKKLAQIIRTQKFESSKGSTQVTLPFIFD